MKYTQSLIYLFFCLFSVNASLAHEVAHNPISANGSWSNKSGSTLNIKRSKNNVLSGTFTPTQSVHKPCIGVPVPITGFINGNGISISMNFETCGSPNTVSLLGKIDGKNMHIMLLEQSGDNYRWNDKTIASDILIKN
ncbi:hypothetical protein JQC92_07075 [Shewanella sp. 202IG2-18]|uniref:avidin/streptavidin family protein n=1 Tax=Parashewanella hymeniacidonis TaxID=2807618 RepID=UPI001961DD06|nr:avidin/streptavidin family protein [Parashewanella hymeniacidonis]MBM7071806.1 hypothetical protein [Parashewanella hymeniacidonis]